MGKLLMSLVVLTSLAGQDLFSQSEEARYKRNVLYFELLGTGGLYSVNLEHRFGEHVSGRVGFTKWSFPGFFVVGAGTLDVTGFPIMLHYLSGGGNHHLDVGLGVAVFTVRLDGRDFFFKQEISGQGTAAVGAGVIGYRYQPRGGGVFFRIGFSPLFTLKDALPTGGMSLGLVF